MMTSIGSERARGNRDKAPPATTQTQPQKQVQATAEQIRLAQMIYDKNDADFEDKVKQLMEVTGKNQDECIVALHDCNEDVNRAINILLEGSSDTTSWETVGKKRSLGKEGSENKENREKRGEREPSRGRGGASRRGRGASRSIEFRSEENGVDLGPGERALDRGRRGRGRGSGGRGRGRAAGASRFSAQGMGTFNPADYTESSGSGAGGSRTDAWESGGNDADDGTGAWRNSMDDWTADDWNEDLSETKVFTASSVPATENHITPGQSIDLVALLQKPAPSSVGGELGCLEPSSPQSLGQSLVFTNSHHSTVTLPPGTTSTTTANSYPHHGLSSVLGSGFGELGGSKLGSSAGAQILEQLKGPGLGQLPPLQAGGGGSSGSSGAPGGSGVTTSSWDIKPMGSQTTTALSQFSEYNTDLTHTHTHSAALSPRCRPRGDDDAYKHIPETSMLRTSLSESPPGATALDNATSQHKQIKPQKRRIPPTSKIPSSAVEMPGSADITGLNVQFGALEFGSEPALQEFGSSDSSTELAPQTQNSLYSKPMSEALSSSMAMPLASVESTYTTAAVTSSSMPPTSAAPPPTTSGAASFEQSPPQHSRITFPSPMAPSPAKEPSPAPVTNGFNGVRTPTGLDMCLCERECEVFDSVHVFPATSASSTPKPESPSLPNVSSLSSSAAPPTPTLLPPSAPQHSSALSSLAPELPSASLPQLSSSLSSNHQNSHSSASVLSSSSALTYTSVDCVSSLPPSTASAFSAAPAPVPPSNSSVGGGPVSVASSLHASGALGLTGNGASVPSVSRTAPLLSSSSGKAPPNLPQGVPPLLPNQYIVGPGGLLPAYPQIYGYEDLQMLQSRLPMDYYGITFPGPTATLAGRDGSLTNNPYSGMLRWVRCAEPWQINMSSLDRGNPFLSLCLSAYTGLPYYPGVPGVPSAFQYGPTMFVPPASAKQHGVGLSTPSTPFQQPSGYSQHSYGSGYDDLTAGTAGGEYGKGGYSGSSQAQAKSAATGPGKGVSVTSSNTGVPDISGSVYNKTQSFDKQGFHAATPPPFSLPSALGGTGPLNPGAAPGYAPAPFLHILPAHQQPHSQLLHHHLQQDSQGGTSQRSQSNSMQQKTQTNKSSYSNSPYWGN
ncbi:UBAP2 protein, partial [Amia calva]|nr:UBAP2 protein [Amia calva]